MRKKNLRKRVLALVLTTILCFASSISVFASSDQNIVTDNLVAVDEATVSTRAISNCVASDGVITSGYGCTITLHLDKSYYNPYFRAGATGNSNNAVYCYVTCPSGNSYYLGSIIADGSTTSYLNYTGTAPAGDYVFHFEGLDAGTTGFLAFIYSSN